MDERRVRELISMLQARGYDDAGLRDVIYAMLAIIFGPDRRIGYKALFQDGSAPPFDQYDHLGKIEALRIALTDDLSWVPGTGKPDNGGTGQEEVSFDDLKQGLIDDMRALEELRDARNDNGPLLDPKEMAQVVARIADIRVKLTDKFGTTERVVEQRVVVNQKYNAICACGREIYLPPGAQIKDPGT